VGVSGMAGRYGSLENIARISIVGSGDSLGIRALVTLPCEHPADSNDRAATGNPFDPSVLSMSYQENNSWSRPGGRSYNNLHDFRVLPWRPRREGMIFVKIH
jgi:hypothetical protein